MLSFNLLTGPDFQEYVSRTRKNGYFWLFQHIPKTAGTSLLKEMEICLAPYRNIFSNYHGTPGNPAHLKQREQSLMDAVDRFLGANVRLHYRSASGHLNPNHVHAIRTALPHTQVFTFLRNPVDRVISNFRYIRTPAEPAYEHFIKQYPTIEDFVVAPTGRNTMWKFVCANRFEADAEGLNKIFNRYAFFGTLEEMSLCFEFLSALSGCPKTPTIQANKTQTNKDNEIEITDEVVELIRENNKNDIAFYDEVTRRLDRIRPRMQGYVDRRRAMYAGEQFGQDKEQEEKEHEEED